jgi:uncharacterized protein HemX
MYWLLAQVSVPDAVKPSLSTLESTLMGALIIVLAVGIVGAVLALIRVQNLRVADQKALSDKSEALMNKMITAFSDMRGALESLKSALEALKHAEQETQNVLSTQQRAHELTLLMRGQSVSPLRPPPTPTPQPEPIRKARG